MYSEQIIEIRGKNESKTFDVLHFSKTRINSKNLQILYDAMVG